MTASERIISNIKKSMISNTGQDFTYIIGNNGAGKSILLQRIATIIDQPENSYINSILCITNAVYDKFKFTGSKKQKYLGLKNSSNAIFHANIDRQILKLLAQGIQKEQSFLEKIERALELSFLFEVGSEKSNGKNTETISELIDGRKTKKITIDSVLNSEEITFLNEILGKKTPVKELNKETAAAFLKFLELNPKTVAAHADKNGTLVSFQQLSSGEQNRTLTALKILGNLQENCLILIDEPEISLHLHWQLEFHSFLKSLLANCKKFHVVIATHSPIIISEAAKDKRSDAIIILENSRHANTEAENIGYREASSKDIKSYDGAILDLFDTATYNTQIIDQKIATSVIKASSGDEELKAQIGELEKLLEKKGVSDSSKSSIAEAINIIKRHFTN